jgi:hypothetical protein
MPPSRAADRPAEPWRSFLDDLDRNFDSPVDLHCIGGFVVSQHYGLGRETADLDILSVIPKQVSERIAKVAGRGSPLHKKHRVCIDHVRVANYPDSYEKRLVRVFPVFHNIRLWALEPHDLALTKLERSSERDIQDILYLAQAGLIRPDVLVKRFEKEMEPYIVGRTPTWHRSTLNMWIESCWPK